MSFEAPGMLFGMLAALVPLLIHLTNRHRARKRPFAALDFLLLSDKRLARRLKVKQLLVLGLRMLLFAAIPFALAKPFTTSATPENVVVNQPGSVAIIVDDSASMSARAADGRTLLEHALQKAQALVSAAGDRTNFAVLTASRPARLLTPKLTYDRHELERALARVHPTFGPSDMQDALREAERVLSRSEERRRQVAIISEHAAHVWRDVTTPWALKTIPTAALIRVPVPTDHTNMGILGVRVRPVGEGAQTRFEVTVQVKNMGTRPATSVASVAVSDKVAATTFRLKPGEAEKRTVTMSLALDNIFEGRVSLKGDDGLGLDDTFFFVVDLSLAVRVLVVNGAPQSVAYLDETFFLRPALEQSSGRIHATYVNPAELTEKALQSMDVVILANVGPLTVAQHLVLKNYVTEGGGLFITAGEHLTPKKARSYHGLMPYPIRSFKQVVPRDSPAVDLHAQRIGSVDTEHPAMAVFGRISDYSLYKARITKHLLLEAAPTAEARIVARYANGAPALIEKKVGQGRVLLLTTTIDQDWGDLALRSSFLPLVHQVVDYLAGKLQVADDTLVRVGDVARVRAPRGTGPLELIRPDGGKFPVRVGAKGIVRVAETELPGFYALERTQDPSQRRVFAVNADPAEFDLKTAQIDKIVTLLARAGEAEGPKIAAADEVRDDLALRSNLWPIALVALFGLLLFEAVLVVRSV